MLRRVCILVAGVGLVLPSGTTARAKAPAASQQLPGQLSEKPKGAVADNCQRASENGPVPRGHMERLLERVPVLVTPEESMAPAPAVNQYKALTDRDAQCRAASQSSLGNLFAEELGQQPVKRIGGRLTQLQQTILAYSEAEARNQSAGAALALFYRLAEAEARWELLEESIRVMDAAVAKTKELTAQGIAVAGDYQDMLRQRIDLQSDLLQLEEGIDRLNTELKSLLGMTVCDLDEPQIWPALDGVQAIPSVDLARAVKEGLARRPQLVLLRILPEALTSNTLPAARMLLRSYNVLLAAETPAKRLRICAFFELLLRALGSKLDLEKIRTELELLAREREQAIAKEIRLAAHSVNSGRQKVALAHEQVRIRRDRLNDLDAKQAKGLVSFKETTLARMEWLRARGELAKAVTDLLTARAKLREAQGTLAQECGFGPTECSEEN